jgi:hypothetical protein
VTFEPKWTPGPWTPGHIVDDNHSCACRYIFGNDGRMGSVATVSLDDGENDSPPVEEAKANSYLIAAAPDLYEALTAFMETYRVDAGLCDDPESRETFGCWVKARSALAKARGEVKP